MSVYDLKALQDDDVVAVGWERCGARKPHRPVLDRWLCGRLCEQEHASRAPRHVSLISWSTRSARRCELPQRQRLVSAAKNLKKKEMAAVDSEITDPKDPTWLEIRQRTSGRLSFLASDLISSLPDRSVWGSMA